MKLSKKNRRRLTKKDLNQLDKISSLLESVTAPTSNITIQPVQTIQRPIVKATVDVKTEFNLPEPFNHIHAADIKLTDHAYERSLQRLSLQRTSETEVRNYLRSKLSKSHYIGKITGKDGTESEVFTWNGIAIMVNPELTAIKTIWRVEKMSYSPALEKMKELIHKEFRKLNRKEKAHKRKLELLTYETNLQISELKLREYKTRSQTVRVTCKSRIRDLEVNLTQLKEELE